MTLLYTHREVVHTQCCNKKVEENNQQSQSFFFSKPFQTLKHEILPLDEHLMAHKSKKVLNLKWQADSQYISEHLIVKCKHEFCNNQPQFTRIQQNSPEFTKIHQNLPQFTRIYHNSPQFTTIHCNSPLFTPVHSRNCNAFYSIEVGYGTLKVKSLSMNYITLMIKFMIFLSIQSSHMDSNLHERGIKEEKPLRPPR